VCWILEQGSDNVGKALLPTFKHLYIAIKTPKRSALSVFGTSKVPMQKTLNALTLEKTYPPYKNLAFQG